MEYNSKLRQAELRISDLETREKKLEKDIKRLKCQNTKLQLQLALPLRYFIHFSVTINTINVHQFFICGRGRSTSDYFSSSSSTVFDAQSSTDLARGAL
jgi:hypothetical protein